MLKDSQPSSQYTFTAIVNPESFCMELLVRREKKNKLFSISLEALQDLHNFEGDGKVFHTVWQGCKKAGLVPKKNELAFLKAFFEFIDRK